MVEKKYLQDCQTTKVEQYGCKQVDASLKIMVQSRLELYEKNSIDVELAESSKMIDG